MLKWLIVIVGIMVGLFLVCVYVLFVWRMLGSAVLQSADLSPATGMAETAIADTVASTVTPLSRRIPEPTETRVGKRMTMTPSAGVATAIVTPTPTITRRPRPTPSASPTTGGSRAARSWLCYSIIGLIVLLYIASQIGQGISILGLQDMSPQDFERKVASKFRSKGYRVDDRSHLADHGVDLMVWRGGERAVVQCKRYKGTVGEPVVRDLLGSMIHEGANKGYVVTSGKFSQPAKEWARGKPIELIDGHSTWWW